MYIILCNHEKLLYSNSQKYSIKAVLQSIKNTMKTSSRLHGIKAKTLVIVIWSIMTTAEWYCSKHIYSAIERRIKWMGLPLLVRQTFEIRKFISTLELPYFNKIVKFGCEICKPMNLWILYTFVFMPKKAYSTIISVSL